MFNKNVKKLFVLIVLLFIVIFVVGVSYAYTHALFYNRESNTTIAVQGGIMEIIYNDPETGGFSPNIVAERVIPGWETTKIFTVTGTNDINPSQEIDTNMYYKVGLKVEENTFSENALTYSLKANNGNTDPSGLVVQDVNGYIPQTDSVWFGVGYFVPSKEKVVHKYELVVSFPETGENQNIDKSKRFAGYVTVVEGIDLVNVSIKVNQENQELNYTKKLLKNSSIILQEPEREGYRFNGWNIISGSATISENRLTVGEDENVEVEAKWKEIPTVNIFDYIEPTTSVPEPYYTFISQISGYYKLELWGAQGGSYNSSCIGGYGGYSTGIVHLDKNEIIYIYIGGKGAGTGKHVYQAGGYNGGGSATPDSDGNTRQASGGGATHVATKPGILSTLAVNKESIIMVAGGGGGSAGNSAVMCTTGGSGGGYKGKDGTRYSSSGSYGTGYGGTQTAGGSFNSSNNAYGCVGEFGTGCSHIIAGGGGGYYGGGVGRTSAGGGSGYIANASLTNKYMSCYNCEQSEEEAIKTMTTTCVNSTPTGNCAKQENGYARITFWGNTLE